MHLYRELSDKGGLVQRMIGLDGAFGRDQVLRRFNKDSELFPVCSIWSRQIMLYPDHNNWIRAPACIFHTFYLQQVFQMYLTCFTLDMYANHFSIYIYDDWFKVSFLI